MNFIAHSFQEGRHAFKRATNKVAHEVESTANRVSKSAEQGFGTKEKRERALKSITHNLRGGVAAGSAGLTTIAATATASGHPEISAALAPVVAASVAAEGTLAGAEELEDALLPTARGGRIKEGEFTKKSAVGKAAEQFVTGEVDYQGAAAKSPFKAATRLINNIPDIDKQRDAFKKEVDEIKG